MTCKNFEHRYFKASYWSEFVLCPKSLENQMFSKQQIFLFMKSVDIVFYVTLNNAELLLRNRCPLTRINIPRRTT